MNIIKVMSDDLSNKIAAGEVVESLMNIVKELVENSIDAKSSDIKVELVNGGLNGICVTETSKVNFKTDQTLYAKWEYIEIAVKQKYDISGFFEDVTDMKPIGVYSVSNNMTIQVYQIEYDIEDRVLAGDSSDETKARWRDIIYGDGEAYFWYGDIRVPFNELMRTDI